MVDVSNSSQWHNPGFFGPVTATLDWCEANYQFSHYIAEMANTLSNLFTILLSVWGAITAVRQSLPTRYAAGYAGVALIGVGSFAFHATLLYQAQLADELPMIYVGSMSLFVLFDVKPNYGTHTTDTKFLISLLVAFDVLFTLSYIIYRNPVYHQIVFATILISISIRVRFLLKWSDLTSSIPDRTKVMMGKLFTTGAALFLLGFVIWNLDNIFCDTLTHWKVAVGWPVAFLLEGHSWWHILTGAGTHFMFVGIQFLTLSIKDHRRNYTVRYLYGFPYVFYNGTKAL